jgi:hypothetical protein
MTSQAPAGLSSGSLDPRRRPAAVPGNCSTSTSNSVGAAGRKADSFPRDREMSPRQAGRGDDGRPHQRHHAGGRIDPRLHAEGAVPSRTWRRRAGPRRSSDAPDPTERLRGMAWRGSPGSTTSRWVASHHGTREKVVKSDAVLLTGPRAAFDNLGMALTAGPMALHGVTSVAGRSHRNPERR